MLSILTTSIARVGLVLLLAAAVSSRGADAPPFRFLVTTDLMRDVNENDTKAALRNWMETITEQSAVPIDPDVLIANGPDAVVRAVQHKEIHALTLTIRDFLSVESRITLTNFLSEANQRGDIYLLLVHKQSPYTNLASLRGKELFVSESSRMGLANTWLDVELMRDGMPPMREFFKTLNRNRKPASLVLPVFFRTTDACLVTERMFEAMGEMNPQVGKDLRIVARSDSYVAGLVCFTMDAPPATVEKVKSGLMRFHESVRGQQVLMLFQSTAVAPLERSAMESAIELMNEHERLSRAARSSIATAGASDPKDAGKGTGTATENAFHGARVE